MQFEGIIKSWNDDRGFGFIAPAHGGQQIFVHVRAFKPGSGRPQLNRRVIFEVKLSRQGKKHAKNVEMVRATSVSRKAGARPPARRGIASLFAIPAFVLLYVTLSVIWHVPSWFATLYLAASLVCIVVYAIDKAAAVAGRRRVSENTLLALGLLGGWPGALIAQQALRHKSSKAAFRSAFRSTVVVNVAAFVVLNSPFVSRLQG